MARNYILPKDGNFYKANLHCHSTCSDGKFTVEKLKELYKEKGYSIIAFSDHNELIPHNELRDEDFLPITSLEVNFDEPFSREKPEYSVISTYHINFFSKDPNRSEFIDFDRVYDLENIKDIIHRANEAGFLVQYNHPRWSYQTVNDFCDLDGLFGFEILNYGCETEMFNGWSEHEYDCYCRSGMRAAAIATDDNHNLCMDINSPYNDSFGGWTMIKAPSLSYDDIMGALERKECYASSGPVIHELYVDAEDGKETIHISCSGVKSLCVITESRHVSMKRANDDSITSHDVTFDLGHKFYRIECVDSMGRKALTRAFWADEFVRG